MNDSPSHVKQSDFSWFDPTVYDRSERYSLTQWYTALWRRLSIRQSIGRARNRGDQSNDDLFKSLVEILTDPHDEVPEHGLFGSEVTPIDYPSVRDFEVIDAVRIVNGVEERIPGTAARANYYQSIFFQDPNELENQLPDPVKLPCGPLFSDDPKVLLRYEAVAIDLAASDEQVQADFLQWLRLARTRRTGSAKRRTITTAKRKSWGEHRVLGYIDLCLASDVLQFKLTDAMAGDLLYPVDDVNRSERIRKVTRPLSEELLDSLERLRTQAARSERKSTKNVPG